MKAFRCIIIILFSLAGCTHKSEEATVSDSLRIDSVLLDSSSDSLSDMAEEYDEESYDEEECVFDTSTYKFTSEALRAFDKNISYRWDSNTASALVRLNEYDSLILHIGGCTHFSYSATFVTDSSKFRDREYLIQKAKWLAKNFFSAGFDEKYVQCIDRKLYELGNSEQKDILFYSIIDPDTAITDHIYDGWIFEKVGAKTRISISGYQN